MAKINSSGASPSRLVPPGSCNQNANPPCIPPNQPDTMISPAKSILCNEIKIKPPTRNPPNPIPPEACFQATRLKLSTSLLLFTAESSVRTCGNFLLWPEDPSTCRLEPAMPPPVSIGTAQKKQTLSLS